MIRDIAVNTQHTGDPRRDHRGYAESWTREQVDSLLAEDWLRQMVADIRGLSNIDVVLALLNHLTIEALVEGRVTTVVHGNLIDGLVDNILGIA